MLERAKKLDTSTSVKNFKESKPGGSVITPEIWVNSSEPTHDVTVSASKDGKRIDIVRKGTPITIPGHGEKSLFLTSDGKEFRITEPKTGLSVGTGDSISKAIKDAKSKLDKPASPFDEAMKKTVAEFGERPSPKPIAPHESINTGALGEVGMGGAKPSEFTESPKTATGTKNATVDQERATRGLPAAVQPLRKAFGQVWDNAMAKIDRDPQYQDRLIDELREKPRALTDEEDAAILQRQVDLQNQYGKATRELAQAADDAKEFPNRQDAVEEHKLEVARLSDQLLDLYNIGKRAGTETGRGLNARKMMVYEDYSLAQMELSKRAAKGGAPLTDAERAQITDLQKRIEETQKAYDVHVEKTKDMVSRPEIDRLINEAKNSAASINPKILETARKIVGQIHTKADEARARIQERLKRTSIGLDPIAAYDLSLIGADHLATKALDIAEWSARMAQDLGPAWEKFKEHAKDIYAASQKQIDKATADNPLELARAMRNKSPEEQINANSEKIGEKLKSGKKDDITWYVQRIARLLVQSGVKDREALIGRVHDILKAHIPDITRRQAMDAISGYGDFKQLSKDKISLELRGLKGEMQQIAKLEDMAKGEPPKKSGVERRTPTEAERQLIKKVNEAKFAFQVPMTDPATQLKSALDTYKTSLKNRTADLEDRIARNDYDKRPKRALVLDREAMRLKELNERAKQQFQNGLMKDRLKQRTPWEKRMDAVQKWRRGFILSGPVTLAKLTSAALARMIVTPTEELVGSALSRIPKVSEIAGKAPREGGASLTAEVKAWKEGIVDGAKDAWSTLRTGHSQLDTLYGRKLDTPQSFIDIFGNIHGALKSPVKRAEWARSMQKRGEFYAKQGVDISDPVIQTRIALESYKDAERSIFMQNNFVANKINAFIKSPVDPKTGHPSLSRKAWETTGRVLLPIVKVPTNIVAETMQYATGLAMAPFEIRNAFKKGIETLKPDEADLIMRHLKKGSIGSAALLAGYFLPQVFGGFYQQGEKRDPKDVKPMGVGPVPASMVHNPLVEAAQMGATVRRVSDSNLRKKDKETQGLSEGAWAGALGLADDIPFVRESVEISKLMNPHERAAWRNAMLKSMVVPQGVQTIAQQLDQPDLTVNKFLFGDATQRKGTNAVQSLESGIPGLRQNVPVKK